MRTFRVAVICMALAAIGSTTMNGGQALPAPSPPWQSQMPTNSVGANPSDPRRTEQQERVRSDERQKRLSADTENWWRWLMT